MADSDEGKMGTWMTSAIVVGGIIGAGIFMLPVTLAPLGTNALIAWPISGVGILCIAFALAQVSSLREIVLWSRGFAIARVSISLAFWRVVRRWRCRA